MALADYIDRKPALTTERLTLRPLCPSDVPALEQWMPDKGIYAYWGKGPGKTDKQPALLFEKSEQPAKSFHLGIVQNADGLAIGELWVYLIEKDRMAKLAMRIGAPWQGRGYATEALREIVRFCFTETELQRLWTDADVRNIPSCRTLERCGFVREGTVRQGRMVNTWCDYHLYAMLKSDWEKA